MFLNRRTQEEARKELRELTEDELSKVAGGVMCTSEPGMKVFMWFATGGLNVTSSGGGSFTCWG